VFLAYGTFASEPATSFEHDTTAHRIRFSCSIGAIDMPEDGAQVWFGGERYFASFNLELLRLTLTRELGGTVVWQMVEITAPG